MNAVSFLVLGLWAATVIVGASLGVLIGYVLMGYLVERHCFECRDRKVALYFVLSSGVMSVTSFISVTLKIPAFYILSLIVVLIYLGVSAYALHHWIRSAMGVPRPEPQPPAGSRSHLRLVE